MLLSKLMEKSFLRLKSPEVRKAFVEAELFNGLAHQIRVLRKQRGWTQQDLAAKLNTTQTAVCRFEDPSYGRLSVKSLLAISEAFDVALNVRFVAFSQLLQQTWDTREANFCVESYETESHGVQFYTESKSSTYIESRTHGVSASSSLEITTLGNYVTNKQLSVISTAYARPTESFGASEAITVWMQD